MYYILITVKYPFVKSFIHQKATELRYFVMLNRASLCTNAEVLYLLKWWLRSESCLKTVNRFYQDHGGTEPASGEEDPSLEVVIKSLTDEESNKAVSDLKQCLTVFRA